MIKYFLTTLLIITASLYNQSATVTYDHSGIQIVENISKDFKFSDKVSENTVYKKCNFPDNYFPVSQYPNTEYYERVFYFAVPETGSPKLNYSLLNSTQIKTQDLVPSEKFSKNKDGFWGSSLVISKDRSDKILPHAEIVFAGFINEMNIYKLIFRPLVINGDKAELTTNISMKITFGTDFENSKYENIIPLTSFESNIINLDFAKSNPVRKKKEIIPTFLDRQTEWFRIKIRDEGIYKITGASIKNTGLDISSVLCDRIKLYSSAGKDIENDPVDSLYPVYHGAQEAARKIVDINGNGFFDDNDYIVFYAVQTTTRDTGSTAAHYYNKYSDYTYYWVDLGIGSLDNGKNISSLAVSSQNYTDISIFQRHEFAETRNSLYAEDDTFRWYNKEIFPLQTLSINFNMKNIDNSYPVNIKVFHALDIANGPQIKYSLNNLPLSEIETSSLNFNFNFDKEMFLENSSNTLSMTNLTTDSNKYYNGFDVVYYGVVQAGAADEYFYAQMNPGADYRFNLGNSTGREILDITDPLNIRSAILSSDNLILSADKEKGSYMLFSGTYKVPVELKLIDRTAKVSLHSVSAHKDMVIISPDEFYDFFVNDEMGYIKAHKESEGDVSSIEIVKISDINDEFGRGYQEPAATRNFIKYAYENWGTEYFLLAGDGNCYIKSESNIPEKNLIYGSDPSYTPYPELPNYSNVGWGSDDFYANLYVKYPMQHVSLGRFTVSNLTELRNVVSKTVSHIKNNNMANYKAKLLLVADDERSLNYDGTWYEKTHIRNTENTIVPVIPNYYYTDKLYMTEYPFEYSSATGLYLKPKAQDDLIRKLQSGVDLFCYIGHGSPMQLAHERIFTPSAFSKVNNYDKYFFEIGATCSFGVFTTPGIKNLSEQMLLAPNQGGVGLINSVAPVFSDSNESLVRAILYAEFFNPLKKLTIGKAMKEGKNGYSSPNSACFMLIGDPALKFFNDQTIVESQSSVELNTLKLDSINSSLNTTQPDQNGFLNTIIVDSEVKRAYFNTEHWTVTTDSLRYTLPGKVILSTNSTIDDQGKSTAKFILPKDLTYGDNKGKVLFYGHNLSGAEYTGSIDSVSIRGDAEITILDSIPPEIRILYNSLNYKSGDPIGQNPVIFADITDENGINTSGGTGHKILMEIDGENIDMTPYFVYQLDSYQKGNASYQLVNLPVGIHNIKISAWDNFNNYNEKTESFEVVNESKKNEDWIGNLLNYPNPIKNKGTTFGFTVNSQIDLLSYTITVYTINGRKVKTIENSNINVSDQFQQCEWNGKDADGDTPANGVYIYILRAKFNDGKTINKKSKLIFSR